MGGRDSAMAFMPYGPRWRTHRKLINDFINVSTTNNYDANQVKAISDFLVNLHQSPEVFREHTNLCVSNPFIVLTRSIHEAKFRLTTSLALSIAYGIQADTPDNEFVRLYKEMTDEMTEASVPGTFFVDIFPLRGSIYFNV
jgi:hypothetical protein